MSQPHPTIINGPLNFRTSDTLITTKVPHYPPKVNTGTLIIPGWTRPNANGMNANINQADFNGPDFKARPLKHWRRQLRVYNNNGKGPSNNSRTARIVDLDRPGLTVYHHTPDCACVDNEGGDSYIIANNKFSYETKGNRYSEPRSDSTFQNNGFNRVPSTATDAEVADPLTPAYETLTGVYNTKCINCSPQHNIIKSAIAYNSQAYYADSFAKQQSRCQTYEQNISTNRADTSTYFGADGEFLWQNNSPTGPQVVDPVEYTPTRLYNKPCVSQTIYKPSNIAFAKQGAVSGATRLRKLVADTVMINGNSFYSAAGAAAANQGHYQGTNVAGNYYVKLKPVVDSCSGSVPGAPILSLVNNLPNAITISWPFSSIGLCNILYYTLTYYPVGMDAVQVTIYPSANNVYTITGVYPDTLYNIYITATNGNGTSENSNIIAVTTLGPNILTFVNATYDTIFVNAANTVVPSIVDDGFTIYRINTTTGTATFTSNKAISSLQYLILGGGGGGGGRAGFNSGGGGGAGAYILDTSLLNATTYNIYIGLGGAPGSISTGNGGSTTLQTATGTFTAGGGGNGYGGGGGCGGGASSNYGYYEAGGQGSLGGGTGQNGGSLVDPGGSPGYIGSGGGGGTSTSGGDAYIGGQYNVLYDGNGGNGISSDITGTATHYGGGGGGGNTSLYGEFPGTGGVGGGGNGGSLNSGGQNGTNGLGGGGGGYGTSGGSGGSGVIILRIPSYS